MDREGNMNFNSILSSINRKIEKLGQQAFNKEKIARNGR